VLNLLILTLTLIGCQVKTNKIPTLNLPEMPPITKKVAEEIKLVCIPRQKCENFNNWLNELYAFKAEYSVFKEELSK